MKPKYKVGDTVIITKILAFLGDNRWDKYLGTISTISHVNGYDYVHKSTGYALDKVGDERNILFFEDELELIPKFKKILII